jgi:CHASE2 domain-containing sensor protein/tRNA A-37 threonylcarbamoyl transferase component Bud32
MQSTQIKPPQPSQSNSPIKTFMVGKLPPLLISLAIASLVVAVRQAGVLKDWELGSYDLFVRSQPAPPPDPRLLIVGIDEEDITSGNSSNRALSELLDKLNQYQPRVIGFDIYRDNAQEPDINLLTSVLQVNSNIIAVCGNSAPVGVAAPANVPESRVGFSDFAVDTNLTVRRNLLSLSPDANSKCRAGQSFGLLLALNYLSKEEGIKLEQSTKELQIGSTTFKPLESDWGAYRNLGKEDANGYQIMLKYHSPKVAVQVTMSQVLKGEIQPAQVKDRIVLVGYTAESKKDFFYTPYSAGQARQIMPGVVVHAQIVSQILSSVKDRSPQIWVWNLGIEFLWVLGWTAIATSLLFGFFHRPILILAIEATIVGMMASMCYVLFTFSSGWVPIAPTALSMGVAIAITIAYKRYSTSLAIGSALPFPVENPLARYKIFETLGEGGFAITYKARDSHHNGKPICVVKQLKSNFREEELQVARGLFKREAETLGVLGRNHDQIPQLLADFEYNKEFYLVQDFIPGQTLQDILEQGPQTEQQVVDWLIDILSILKYIHSEGVVHRDIKPSNLIIRDSDKKFVLIDFGAVKILQTHFAEMTVKHKSKSVPSAVVGTPGYIPPEQLAGQPTPSSDIYALGVVALQALTGLNPYELLQDGEFVWQNAIKVSEKLATILDKMVKPLSSERYQSAHEVIHALESLYKDSIRSPEV